MRKYWIEGALVIEQIPRDAKALVATHLVCAPSEAIEKVRGASRQ